MKELPDVIAGIVIAADFRIADTMLYESGVQIHSYGRMACRYCPVAQMLLRMGHESVFVWAADNIEIQGEHYRIDDAGADLIDQFDTGWFISETAVRLFKVKESEL